MNKNQLTQISPFIQTRSLDQISKKAGNLYEAIVIVGKRSNQINVNMREELHSKLNEFASTTDNLEEVFENREQIEISRYYEKLPNPALIALEEFFDDEINVRNPEA